MADSLRDFLKKTYAIRLELKSRAKSVLKSSSKGLRQPLPLLKHPFRVIPQLLSRETRHLSVIYEEKKEQRALKRSTSPSPQPLSTSRLPSCKKPRLSRVLQRVYSPCPLDLSWLEEKSRRRTVPRLVEVKSFAVLGPVLGGRSYRAKSISEQRGKQTEGSMKSGGL